MPRDHFPISLRAIIIQHDAVLLVQYHDGRWDCPGGHLACGEQPDAALGREVKHITGLDIQIGGIVTAGVHDGVMILTYSASTDRATISLSDEYADVAWVSPDRLATYALVHPAVMDQIRQVRSTVQPSRFI